MNTKHLRDDAALAVAIAAERRRYDEQQKAELDARRAELPRAIQDRERWQFWKTLAKRVMRRVLP